MKGKWAIAVCLVLSMVATPSALAGASETRVVEPTGVDDTTNLQEALDWAAEQPARTVELTAGKFFIHQPLVVRNLSGTVRGQGKDKTSLYTNTDPFPIQSIPEDLYGPFSAGGMLMFLYDDGAVADLRVEGLGLYPIGDAVPEPNFGNIDIVPILIDTGRIGQMAYVNTTLRDLRMQGDRGDRYPAGTNMFTGLVLLRLVGTHTISGVDFDTSFALGFVSPKTSGKLIVGGPHPEDRVTFTDIGWAGMLAFSNTNLEIDVSNVQARNIGGTTMVLYALDNCRVHMSGVETVDASGAVVGPCFALGCATEPSTYLFEHNIIRQQQGTYMAGFELYGPEPWSSFVIRNNRIQGEDTAYGPIYTEGIQGAVITNNQLSGSGPAAMALGIAGMGDSGLMVKGNNVQGWKVEPYEDVPGVAPIWLGAETSGNTVVGSGNLRTNVFDETDVPETPAYDGANILVGVNSQGAHIGQAIRDAMQTRVEAKKLLMKGPY